MEDNQLLQQLKGQKWERITAVEDKGIKLLLVSQDQPVSSPYMYSDYLDLLLKDIITEESIINGFQALKKLGLLKDLRIQTNKSALSQNPISADCIQKISSELGKLKVLNTLKLYYFPFIDGQQDLLNDLHRIETLQKLRISIPGGFPQETEQLQNAYSGILSKCVECTNLKSLNLYFNFNHKITEEFLVSIQKLSKLHLLEEFFISSSIESEDFYEAFSNQLSKLPSLKKFYIQFIRTLGEDKQAEFGKGIQRLTQNIIKSLSLEEFVMDTSDIGEVEEKYEESLNTLASLKSLKHLKLIVFGDKTIFKNLERFTQLERLSLGSLRIKGISQMEFLKNLPQLKDFVFEVAVVLNHKEKKELAQYLKHLKNLTHITIYQHCAYYKDVVRFLPNLVVVDLCDQVITRGDYIEQSINHYN